MGFYAIKKYVLDYLLKSTLSNIYSHTKCKCANVLILIE